MPLRNALVRVQPYRPQRPMRELQAELGLQRIVKLASNEGAFGPLPAAVAAFEAAVGELNRYPDGGGLRLREALAERHELPAAQVVLGNGADELIRLCAVATLDAGDAAAFPWPSFPSYVAAAACSGAEPVRVPLAGRAFDLDALRVGYALASPDVADALDRVRPIFNVNQPAQEAALASLHELEAVALRVQHARRARHFLERSLASAGLEPEPSQANFVYADVPRGDARPGRPCARGGGLLPCGEGGPDGRLLDRTRGRGGAGAARGASRRPARLRRERGRHARDRGDHRPPPPRPPADSGRDGAAPREARGPRGARRAPGARLRVDSPAAQHRDHRVLHLDH